MRKTSFLYKILLVSGGVVLAAVILGWTFYFAIGHSVIEIAFKSDSNWFFDYVMEGKSSTPLVAYLAEGNRLMLAGTFWILVLYGCCLVFFLFLTKPVEMMIACFSCVGASITLFTLLELFPSLIIPLGLGKIEYYAYKANFLPDPVLGFREKPGRKLEIKEFGIPSHAPFYEAKVHGNTLQWITDRYGFRNSDGVRRSDVVVIGDSYVEYGENEEDTFPKRLERHLTGLNVANLGKSGYGPFQYLEVLKRYGVEMSPKFAIFAFYEGNDIGDIERYLQWKRTDRTRAKPRPGTGGGYHYGRVYEILTLKNLVSRYLVAVQGVARYFIGAIGSTGELFVQKIAPIDAHVQPSVAVLKIGTKSYQKLFIDLLSELSSEEMLTTEEWKELRQIIVEFKSVCEKHGIVPVILYIPTAANIYGRYSDEESGFQWIGIQNQQINAAKNMEKAMLQLAAEVQVEVINLSAVYEIEADKGQLLYYSFNAHWNAEGREIAAQFVAEYLRTKHSAYLRKKDKVSHSPKLSAVQVVSPHHQAGADVSTLPSSVPGLYLDYIY